MKVRERDPGEKVCKGRATRTWPWINCREEDRGTTTVLSCQLQVTKEYRPGNEERSQKDGQILTCWEEFYRGDNNWK